MKDEMNIDDFEQFLRIQADKNRMYPDDQIWRNINQHLHGNNRWPALTFGAILTGALLTASLIFLHPDKDLFKLSLASNPGNTQISKPSGPNNINARKTGTVGVAILKPMDEKTAIYTFNYQPSPVEDQPADSEMDQAVHESILTMASTTGESIQANETTVQNGFTPTYKNIDKDIQPAITVRQVDPGSPLMAEIRDNEPENNSNGLVNKPDDAMNGASVADAAHPAENIQLQEFSKNEPAKTGVHKKLGIEVYGGSSISYRELSEPSMLDYHFPYNAAITANPRSNVNDFVRQRSSIGFEFGTALHFPVTDRLTIKAGLQFNYRQYNIDASAASVRSSVLLLNNSDGRDSMVVYSAIGNSGGYGPLSLRNRYFQLGAPVGFDWIIAGGDKLNFSLGASLQPTYQLNTNIYMITSDYKSYTQQPDMIRRWNMNGAVEALATFKSGSFNWQLGPQIRYQMLPTQMNNFSVHEHLVDYGVKLGVFKQIN